MGATLKMRDFNYSPSGVLVRGASSVRITLENQSPQEHTFTSEAWGVDVVVPSGTSRTVTLHVPGRGDFQFWCRFHQSIGMQGILHVAG